MRHSLLGQHPWLKSVNKLLRLGPFHFQSYLLQSYLRALYIWSLLAISAFSANAQYGNQIDQRRQLIETAKKYVGEPLTKERILAAINQAYTDFAICLKDNTNYKVTRFDTEILVLDLPPDFLQAIYVQLVPADEPPIQAGTLLVPVRYKDGEITAHITKEEARLLFRHDHSGFFNYQGRELVIIDVIMDDDMIDIFYPNLCPQLGQDVDLLISIATAATNYQMFGFE